jgi:hypothetical protein
LVSTADQQNVINNIRQKSPEYLTTTRAQARISSKHLFEYFSYEVQFFGSGLD